MAKKTSASGCTVETTIYFCNSNQSFVSEQRNRLCAQNYALLSRRRKMQTPEKNYRLLLYGYSICFQASS